MRREYRLAIAAIGIALVSAATVGAGWCYLATHDLGGRPAIGADYVLTAAQIVVAHHDPVKLAHGLLPARLRHCGNVCGPTHFETSLAHDASESDVRINLRALVPQHDGAWRIVRAGIDSGQHQYRDQHSVHTPSPSVAWPQFPGKPSNCPRVAA